MKELKEMLKDAYAILSTLTVSGDAVDAMAAARKLLRDAYELADAPKKSDG